MFKRYFKRVCISLALLALVASLLFLVAYGRWRTNNAAALDSGSKIFETASGSIECAVNGNVASPSSNVMVLHGSPGGYDAGVVLANWIQFDGNTRVIIPSRPGYLRTPIDVGVLPSEAADAMIALLDQLKIDKVTVLGWSGAGPTAIEMATRYPDRINGLVLLSARVRSDEKYQFSSNEESASPFDPKTVDPNNRFFGPDFSSYAKVCGFNMTPDFFIRSFFSKQIASLDVTVDRLRQLSKSTQPPSRREMGRQNDVWQFALLKRDPVISVESPTLIIHSPIDDSVGFEHAKYINDAIPNSELLRIENESHFSTMNDVAAKRLKSFINSLESEPINKQ